MLATLGMTSCSDFLDDQKPQGTLSDEQVKDPKYVDNLVISAYAIFISAEDINSSFSMWNFDVRSDDAYKGGNGTSDGDVFHQLEIEQGVLTTNWNISDMWQRLYNCISRVNTAISLLDQVDASSYPKKSERLAEMKFLRAYAHFLLKRLYKNIPFIIDANLTADQYNTLPNRVFKNKHLAGRMGGNRVTIQNLEIAQVVPEKNVILIKGNVPGAKKSLITIKSAVKAGK